MHNTQSGPKKLGSFQVAIISNVGGGGLCSICGHEFVGGQTVACFETGEYTGPSSPELIAMYGHAAHLSCLAASLGGRRIISDTLNVGSVVTEKERWIEFSLPNQTVRIPASQGPHLAYKITVASGCASADYYGLKFLQDQGIDKRSIVRVLSASREKRKEVINSKFGLTYTDVISMAFEVFLTECDLQLGIDASAYIDWNSKQPIQ